MKHSLIKSSLAYLLICGLLSAEIKHKNLTGKDSPPPSARSFLPSRSTETQTNPPELKSQPKGSLQNTFSPNWSVAKPESCQEHSVDTFTQIGAADRPQAGNPEGVYFISDLRESPQLFFLRSPLSWPEQLTFTADGVSYFSVSPDGNKILVASDVMGDEQYNIHLLERKIGRVTPLIVDRQSRVESVAWEPNSQWFAFTWNKRNGVDMDLYRFELSTKKATLLTELKGANEITDVAPDSSQIALTRERSITDADVWIWNAQTKGLSNLTPHTGDEAYRNAIFTSNSKNLILISDVPSGITHLKVLSVNSPEVRTPLNTDKWDVDEFKLDRSRTALVYSLNEDGYSRLVGYRIDGKGTKRGTLKMPELGRSIVEGLSVSDWSQRGLLFYARSSSFKTSDIWSWRPVKEYQWSQIPSGLIDPSCFSEERLVRYSSYDNVSIPAYVYYPKGAQGPVPFLMYVHGGPEAQFRPYFARRFQYFLEHGFGIFAPNVRGSSGYGKQFTMLDNYNKRMDSVRDAIEGARWLIKTGLASPGKVGIYGGSYGGFMVLRAIEVEPDLFAAASESVGIANFVTFLKNTKPYRRALREVEYGPLSDEEFLKSISPTTYVGEIKTPLLIFHGANDPRVPVSETQQIVDALKKKNIPVEFKIFQDEGHGSRKQSNIMIQSKQMAVFFEKYLMEKK